MTNDPNADSSPREPGEGSATVRRESSQDSRRIRLLDLGVDERRPSELEGREEEFDPGPHHVADVVEAACREIDEELREEEPTL